MRAFVAAIALAVAASVGATAIPTPAAAAAPRPTAPAKLPSVPGHDQPTVANPKDVNPSLAAAPAVTWPKAATTEVALASAATAALATTSSWAWATGAPVAVRPATTSARSLAAGPGRVGVRVYDRADALRAGYDVVVRVQRADGVATAAPVQVAVGYGGFAQAYGGNWAGRLRLVALPQCALSTPGDDACRAVEVPTSNDSVNKLVTADVSLVPQGTLLALAAGTSSDGGDFGATDLKATGTWTAGGSAGGFNWSYPLRVPAGLGGPSPTVALSYSSQSVDGQTAATNGQPSWVGEGFSWQPGSIERSYRTCSDDGQAGSHDMCWAGDNATISLNGRSSTLFRDTATGQWRPTDDDGSKIERLNDGSLGNGDDDGEYWKVITPDGIQYFFGLNKLPGAPAGTTTDSVFYEPVFGNGDAEPCHGATFAASSCQQAYRWNLDYVVDPHNNSMSLFYTRETNQYARNNSATDTPTYIRGGYVREIDYGTRQDNGVDSVFSGTAPARVRFGVVDRCVTPGATCTTAVANKANWPDVPLDLICAGSGCANRPSPSFFTTKMLSTITTEVATGSQTWRRVQQWTLGHGFKSPGDGNAAILWLSDLGHCGVDDNTCLPKVTFSSTQKSNRVDKTGTTDSIIRYRIQSITNEYGGVVSITYSDPQCVPGVTMPANPESNTLRCFPQYWTPVGATAPKLEYFHKYVVTAVAEADAIGSTDAVTYYTYPGPAAWHHDDNPISLPTRRTWNDWRGYDLVRTVKGVATDTQQKSETRYFRGMDGDALPSGTRSVSITDSDGVSWPDSDWFSGMTRETLTYLGTGSTVVSAVKSDPYQFGPTGTAALNGVTLNAYATSTAVTTSKMALDHAPSWLTTRSTSTFTPDRYARTATVNDEGDVSTTADDRCTRYTFGANPAGTIVSLPVRSETVAVRCAATPDRSKDVIADVRFRYDNATAYTTTVSQGDQTATEQMSAWNAASPGYQTTVSKGFDLNGRMVSETDSLGRTMTSALTPTSGAPVTQLVKTNAKGWTTTTTLDPGFGVALSIKDANGQVTQGTYDGLGRLTAVWRPGRTKTDLADTTYSYTIRNSGGPSVVTTGRLNKDGTQYIYSYELFDGNLRLRQTQAPAVGGGRNIAETIYDSRGNAVKKRPAYFNSSSPGTALFIPAGDLAVPNQTVVTYDGAGRDILETIQANGAEFSHTTTYYGGDHVDVTVPNGGSGTSTWSDARGQVTQVRTYRGNAPTGTYDTSTRTFTKSGDLASIADSAGNVWSFTYDQQHRKLTETAPDRGTTTFTYSSVGERLTAKDNRQQVLSYTYDELGRQTAEYAGPPVAANLRASWTFDTLSKGQLTSSTRYDDSGNAYTVGVAGYTARGESTGSVVTIPPSAGPLAGQYTTTNTYNADGTVKTTTLPAKTGASTTGGLAPETLTFGYDALSMPTTLSGQDTYVTDTQYLQTGELSSLNTTIGNGKNVLQYWTYEPGTMRMVNHQVLGDFAAVVAKDDTYSYDKAGDVVSISDRLAQYNAGPDDTQCFAYDGSQRLVEAWTPTSGNCDAATRSAAALGGPAPYWSSYTYTAAGNRKTEVRHTSAGDLTRTSAYPASSSTAVRPHAVTAITNSGLSTSVDSFSYDLNGNVTTRAIAGKPTQTLFWSPENTLTKVSDSTGTTSNVYDADGNRLLVTAASATTLYLGSTELKLTGSTVTATRFYGFAGQTVAVRSPDGLFWQTADSQGTGQLSFRATDLTLTRRRSDPFGNQRTGSGTWPTSRGYLGATADGTGLTHLGAREYDPVTGAFISVDPVLSTEDLRSMSTYSYANNNPVTLSDADGRDPGDECAHPGNHQGRCGPEPGSQPAEDDQPVLVWSSDWDDGLPASKKPKHKEVHRYVFVYKKVVLMVVQCGPGAPQDCQNGLFVFGEATSCGGGNGTSANSPACWVGGDGHAYDLFGNKSCLNAKASTVCGNGAPPALNLGCGPHGAPPQGWTGGWPPQYLNPADPNWKPMKPEHAMCEGRGEQCKAAEILDNLVDLSGYCSLPVCAGFGLIGGLVVAGYYVSTGEYQQAWDKTVSSVAGYYAGAKVGNFMKAADLELPDTKMGDFAQSQISYYTGKATDFTLGVIGIESM